MKTIEKPLELRVKKKEPNFAGVEVWRNAQGEIQFKDYGKGGLYIHDVVIKNGERESQSNKFVNAIEQEAKKRKMSFVEIDIFAVDEPMRLFYESRGYQAVQSDDITANVCVTYRKEV